MPRFPHKICDLPDDEGSVVTITDMPKAQHVLERIIGGLPMRHGSNEPNGEMAGYGCGGDISTVQVSPKKTVLFCKDCGLRSTVPQGIVTYGDLRKHFSKV